MRILKLHNLVLIVTFVSLTLNGFAQDDKPNRIKKNDFIISTGYGFPSALRVYLNREVDNPDLTVTGYGPAILKLDYALFDRFTIGLSGFYNYSDVHWTSKEKNLDGIEQEYREGVQVWEAAASVRLNYYFLQKGTWNFYGGLGAGVGFANAETYSFAPIESLYINHRFPAPYNFEGTVGARLFLLDKIALYGELGVGQGFLLYDYYFIPAAIAQFGLSVKL